MTGSLTLSNSRIRILLLAFAAALALGGCGLFSGEEEDKTVNWSAEKLYTEAQTEMAEGGWDLAVKYLQNLQTRFPFGRYAQQSLMEECYAQWKAYENEQALAACDRFIKQYPNSPNIAYVWYLKGLINFNGNLGPLGRYTGQDPAERDPKSLRASFEAFREITQHFASSRYYDDSVLRMRYLIDALASHEVYVAGYYLRRGAPVAAVDRAKGVLTSYQESDSTADALEIMVLGYDMLGMTTLRDDARRVLEQNYPTHHYGRFTPVTKHWWKFW